jgi:hypothetical protein
MEVFEALVQRPSATVTKHQQRLISSTIQTHKFDRNNPVLIDDDTTPEPSPASSASSPPKRPTREELDRAYGIVPLEEERLSTEPERPTKKELDPAYGVVPLEEERFSTEPAVEDLGSSQGDIQDQDLSYAGHSEEQERLSTTPPPGYLYPSIENADQTLDGTPISTDGFSFD